MNIFDIIGPVMVGPSSSHTAGAVKIGYAARKLMDCDITEAKIYFYGSFRTTGHGHGTDLAITAGLLGMRPDDERIPHSLEAAKMAGMKVTFGEVDLKEAHPNSVMMRLKGANGKEIEIVGESLGGSIINIASIDGLAANFGGDLPTLIVHNDDEPGHVAAVTNMLAANDINIATMKLYRSSRGGSAAMIIEIDQEVPEECMAWLRQVPGIFKVTYYSVKDKHDTAADRIGRDWNADKREDSRKIKEEERGL